MVKKKDMTAQASDLKEQLSKGFASATPTNSKTDEDSPQPLTKDDEFERLLEEHGVDTVELKGLAENFLTEFKDISAKNPLLTVTGAFLLGFLAGRASGK